MKRITYILLATLMLLMAACSPAPVPQETQKPPVQLEDEAEEYTPVISLPPEIINTPVPIITEEPYIPEPTSIKLTVVGDCMLASYKGSGRFNTMTASTEPEYFLGGVVDIFRDDDFTIVNLENTLTDRNLQPRYKDENPGYWYYGPTSNIDILKCSSVEVVNISNNHSGDYGDAGTDDTIGAITGAGMLVGMSTNIVYLEKEGYKVALVCNGLWGSYHTQNVINRINLAKDAGADYVVVYVHGGEMNTHTPEQWKVTAYHQLVDAGADLVIGNHPHCLQPMEIYHDSIIIYSIGNFCYGGDNKPENRTIIFSLELLFHDNGNIERTYKIIPCYVYTGDINNFRPEVIEDPEVIDRVLTFMAEGGSPL